MIIVDSCAWVDWMGGADTAAATRLHRAWIHREEIGITPLILAEVLQGARTDGSFNTILSFLGPLPAHGLDRDGHVDAARLYRRLRSKGTTVRGLVDCVIAQTCIAGGAELLTSDRDFLAIAKHSPLKLCDLTQ